MRWVNRHMRRQDRLFLGGPPIALLLLLYLFLAMQRHSITPADKILPLPAGMAQSLGALMAQPLDLRALRPGIPDRGSASGVHGRRDHSAVAS